MHYQQALPEVVEGCGKTGGNKMQEVKIQSKSLFPNNRTIVQVGKKNWTRDINAMVLIMQTGKPNTLIMVTKPDNIDIEAAIKQEIVAKDSQTFGKKIVETIKDAIQ